MNVDEPVTHYEYLALADMPEFVHALIELDRQRCLAQHMRGESIQES